MPSSHDCWQRSYDQIVGHTDCSLIQVKQDAKACFFFKDMRGKSSGKTSCCSPFKLHGFPQVLLLFLFPRQSVTNSTASRTIFCLFLLHLCPRKHLDSVLAGFGFHLSFSDAGQLLFLH